MVLKKINRRTTVVCLLLTLVVAFTTRALLIIFNPTEPVKEDETEEIVEPEPEPEPEPIITTIDFQPTVEAWVNSVGGTKGIVIYDLDLDKVVGYYNPHVNFATASLYKLFVVYEGYRRVQNGTWDGDEKAGWTSFTIKECLDLAIRESHSPCAETLWGLIGHEELNYIAQNDFGIPDVIVSNLLATPYQIMEMLKLYYYHTEITNENLIAIMKDSFLNQPTTTYNWRQGLPSGFSDQVNVYNKVGWNWDGERWTIYDDAAIINFVNENRHFIVVVMSSNVNYQQIKNFATQIESTFYAQNVLKN
ncbi:serine hydrolase [Candidatus Saccharibacteria bacterium]|nr:serine hydrolase [Candidatus Saccharibacteria bacterium]